VGRRPARDAGRPKGIVADHRAANALRRAVPKVRPPKDAALRVAPVPKVAGPKVGRKMARGDRKVGPRMALVGPSTEVAGPRGRPVNLAAVRKVVKARGAAQTTVPVKKAAVQTKAAGRQNVVPNESQVAIAPVWT
jgi:hypothetical protein